MKSLDVFQDHKHLLLVPGATGSAVTAKDPAASGCVFRLSAHDTMQADLMVEDIVRRGFSRVALLADKTGYGEGGFNDVLKFLADRQMKPVYTARFALGVKSLAQEVAGVRAAGADVIVGYPAGLL